MAEMNGSPDAARQQFTPPPPTQHIHPRRNNRNRKSNQYDGAVSDGAVVNPAVSPRPNKAHHKHRVSVAGAPGSDFGNMGKSSANNHRPVPIAAGQVLGTPAKEQAYAGPTFQASPAASSLPMPRYFSRSLPNNAAHPSLAPRLPAEKAPENPQSPSGPDVVALATARESQKSPLDFFFQADREEKERVRNGSGSLSPDSARRPAPPATMPRKVSAHSEKGMFLQELDGHDNGMPSPRTAPPNHRPHLIGRAHSSYTQSIESDDDRQAKTKSLKELLFHSVATPPQSHSSDHSGTQTPDEIFGSPSPFQRSPSGPSTPQPSADANCSLHYGNRNLSPLFKAARSETPPRPSSLRQEVAGNQSPVDTNTLARSYLQEQIRSAAPTNMPQLSFGDRPRPLNSQDGRTVPAPVSTKPVNTQYGSAGSAETHESRPDLRGMEDNLRRMLKIA